MRLQGWSITAAWVALLLAAAGGVVLVGGWNEESLRVVVRSTARTATVLLVVVFSASSLRGLWRSAATRWILANRRYLGVSFAATHGLHLIALALLDLHLPREVFAERPAGTLALGASVYLAIAALALTSSDEAQRRLGRRWRVLHRVGIYWIWLAFTADYLAIAAETGEALHAALGSLLLAGLALRVLARVRSRSGAAGPARVASG